MGIAVLAGLCLAFAAKPGNVDDASCLDAPDAFISALVANMKDDSCAGEAPDAMCELDVQGCTDVVAHRLCGLAGASAACCACSAVRESRGAVASILKSVYQLMRMRAAVLSAAEAARMRPIQEQGEIIEMIMESMIRAMEARMLSAMLQKPVRCWQRPASMETWYVWREASQLSSRSCAKVAMMLRHVLLQLSWHWQRTL